MPPLQPLRSEPPPVLSRSRRPPWRVTGLICVVLCLAMSCGDDRVRQPDVIPPGPVTGLQVIDVTSRSITLSWQASGDDGTIGTAKQYDLRYSFDPITEATFPLATPVPNLPTPTRPGTTQAVLVYNLRSGTGYHVALRVEDEARNPSPLAHLGPMATSADTIPPAAITDLVVASTTPTSFTLEWTAPGDDGTHGQVEGYEIRYATVPLDDAEWEGARIAPHVGAPLPAGQRQSVEISGLPSRRTLYLAVRARDAAENLSPLSNVRPARITGVPRTWYVRQDGTGDMTRIQTGIDSSANGDTVLVAAGTYNEAIDFKGRAVLLTSEAGPEATILDGRGLGRSIVTFQSREPREATLRGFTLTRGEGTRQDGGAILCKEATSPSISSNVFVDNVLPVVGNSFGGAIAIAISGSPEFTGGKPLIAGNQFLRNSVTGNGGAIWVNAGAAEIRDNLFRDNYALRDGGAIGLLLGGGGPVDILHNRFENNVADDHGGAIEAANAPEVGGINISWNLFVGNAANGTDSPDLDTGTGGGISARVTTGIVSHNTLIGNRGTGRTNCTGGGILVTGAHLPIEISFNLIVDSEGCAVNCRGQVFENIRNNLFWNNTPQDLGSGASWCTPDLQANNVFLDPLICGKSQGDYRLDVATPARVGGEVIGAFSEPGCLTAGPKNP